MVRVRQKGGVAQDTVQTPPGPWELQLLGEFQLRAGTATVALSSAQERLLAFLALQRRAVSRKVVAASLWEWSDSADGVARLRNAVWRLRRSAPTVLETTRERLALARALTTDLDRAVHAAQQVATEPAVPADAGVVALLERDVLPDWYDDWVVIERERFRRIRLHALEGAARALTGVGRYAEAVQAAGAAVDAEPLRESAHRVLVEVHIAEGNWWEALRQYERCCRVLRDELGLGPSPELARLVAAARDASAIARRQSGDGGGAPWADG